MKIKDLLALSLGSLSQDLQIVNWKQLGLKSPKLSKYMLSERAMPSRLANFLLSWFKDSSLVLTSREDDILNQSVSAHFSSCQTPGSSNYMAHEDIAPARRGDLVLVVARTPRGFLTRAKVRRCVCEITGRTAGWWIEPVYGQPGSPLYAHQVAFLLKKAGEENPEYLGFGRGVQHSWWKEEYKDRLVYKKVTVPSCKHGYQDTLKKNKVNYRLPFVYVEAKMPDVNDVLNLELTFKPKKYRTIGILEANFLKEKKEFDYGSRYMMAVAALRKAFRHLRKTITPEEYVHWVTNGGVWAPAPSWGIISGEGPHTIYGTVYTKRKGRPYFVVWLTLGADGYLMVKYNLSGEVKSWKFMTPKDFGWENSQE